MKVSVKFALITMIAVSVVSDSMLLPFYPQFFQSVFAVADPQQVGLYLGATSLVVMLAFPLWAAAAKTVPVIRLLIYTQFAAGVLSVFCYLSVSLLGFWWLSLLMLMFKGSYLLIYPHVMRFEEPGRHSATIGLLSVIVHLGAILGAGTGGFVLQLFEPRQVFLLMSVGDFIQMLICCVLLGHDRLTAQEDGGAETSPPRTGVGIRRVYQLGLVMLLFYFSTWLVRPFFSRYWEAVSEWDSEIVSGLVFAIPGAMAVIALVLSKQGKGRQGIVSAILLGIAGLLLQASQQELTVLAGRCLYGWALYQTTVGLDLQLFTISTPAFYATDFSKIYFLQSLGALLALFSAGSLVAAYTPQMPLFAGAAGLLATLLVYAWLFPHTKPAPQEPYADAPVENA